MQASCVRVVCSFVCAWLCLLACSFVSYHVRTFVGSFVRSFALSFVRSFFRCLFISDIRSWCDLLRPDVVWLCLDVPGEMFPNLATTCYVMWWIVCLLRLSCALLCFAGPPYALLAFPVPRYASLCLALPCPTDILENICKNNTGTKYCN